MSCVETLCVEDSSISAESSGAEPDEDLMLRVSSYLTDFRHMVSLMVRCDERFPFNAQCFDIRFGAAPAGYSLIVDLSAMLRCNGCIELEPELTLHALSVSVLDARYELRA